MGLNLMVHLQTTFSPGLLTYITKNFPAKIICALLTLELGHTVKIDKKLT